MADNDLEILDRVQKYSRKTWVKIVLWGFDLLYHNFAWVYDFAAWVASAGRWNDWIRAAGWLVAPGPLLDLGCGKGILLQQAAERGIFAVGLDESPQMLRYSRKLLQGGNLARGKGQSIPIKTASFQTVAATFPAPYIFEPETLNEIRRVLIPEGRLIILLTVEVTGNSMHEHLIRFFAGVTRSGQVSESFQEAIKSPLRECGFMGHLEWIAGNNARLLVIKAQPV